MEINKKFKVLYSC